MKKMEEIYLNFIESFQKKERNESSNAEIDKTLLEQSAKLSQGGLIIYHLHLDDYEIIKWPYKMQIKPKQGNLDAEAFSQLVHPDLRKKMAMAKQKAFKIGMKMSPDDLHEHKLEIECTMQVAKGVYRLMLLQYLALQLDPDGFVKNFIVHITPIHAKVRLTPICCIKLVDLRNNMIVFKVGRSIFPKKRLDVLKGIEKDKTASEIALETGKSIDTVYEHRKALTNEDGFENIYASIDTAKRMGLLNDNYGDL
jgi:hypothetical protein